MHAFHYESMSHHTVTTLNIARASAVYECVKPQMPSNPSHLWPHVCPLLTMHVVATQYSSIQHHSHQDSNPALTLCAVLCHFRTSFMTLSTFILWIWMKRFLCGDSFQLIFSFDCHSPLQKGRVNQFSYSFRCSHPLPSQGQLPFFCRQTQAIQVCFQVQIN